MQKKVLVIVFLFLISFTAKSQTTDLAIIVEAQDLNGNGVSQVNIYEEFQYLITIINSGNDVNNATFSQLINLNVSIISFESINNIGGASEVTGFNLTANNELLGLVEILPNNSSVQIRVFS